jgi:MFS family permease
MLLGTILIITEVYLTFIYISAGHSFFSQADKVSIMGAFCYFVLMIITGGMIDIFEKNGRLRIVMIFVMILQLTILVFLAFNLVVAREHRPVHAKITLKKKFKTVLFDLSEDRL